MEGRVQYPIATFLFDIEDLGMSIKMYGVASIRHYAIIVPLTPLADIVPLPGDMTPIPRIQGEVAKVWSRAVEEYMIASPRYGFDLLLPAPPQGRFLLWSKVHELAGIIRMRNKGNFLDMNGEHLVITNADVDVSEFLIGLATDTKGMN